MKASDTLAGNLQRVLVNLIDLHVQGKQAHWNVAGKNFRDIHLQLDEIISAARGFSDEIAERMSALYSAPDGRAATITEQSDLTAYPDGKIDVGKTVALMVERLDAVSNSVRDVHDAVEQEDPSTSDTLHAIILELEKQRWMLEMENQ